MTVSHNWRRDAGSRPLNIQRTLIFHALLVSHELTYVVGSSKSTTLGFPINATATQRRRWSAKWVRSVYLILCSSNLPSYHQSIVSTTSYEHATNWLVRASSVLVASILCQSSSSIGRRTPSVRGQSNHPTRRYLEDTRLYDVSLAKLKRTIDRMCWTYPSASGSRPSGFECPSHESKHSP